MTEEISFDAKGRLQWGRRAAGLLMRRGDGRVLLVLRSQEVLDPGVWGIPGGRIEPGYEAEDAAVQEALEELGSLPAMKISRKRNVYKSGGFQYTTFLALVPEKAAAAWEPTLNWENDEWGWFGLDALPSPLHPNVKKAIQELLS
jgi:8-oxo-dGTP pyrophosphatase MutT (NUDIX family)